jgi:hypothetical protein
MQDGCQKWIQLMWLPFLAAPWQRFQLLVRKTNEEIDSADAVGSTCVGTIRHT